MEEREVNEKAVEQKSDNGASNGRGSDPRGRDGFCLSFQSLFQLPEFRRLVLGYSVPQDVLESCRSRTVSSHRASPYGSPRCGSLFRSFSRQV